ncbi:DUF4377 domain-containing protein [Acinetobacter guillouiae]|jgi:heat shock protein HslJ|uniref:DUF4377 domain-containing protein n=2 Tax=Acinetobacter guillouiae TaxID=106649 RepID=N8Y7T7_ACIGI|nr:MULTISPECIES: META and DUF4377 domain-containing protein [Acinetobacter]ENU60402.1 hypothetical protein F981_00314 [Acinetobacter guillouiae CIP 63.46]ENV15395.1 hypothetical protein F964_04120 [Acinetobacter guillouiae NIPH 991]EPH38488.1 putative signal peptide protein [Acinetobacter guillouiae MSP4-18]KAB0630452.1 DUF4377 domain-containing protein [Acinetobacter guillouiae]KEC85139.1 signal peptide protein [Acinetobacter sp. ETR1]
MKFKYLALAVLPLALAACQSGDIQKLGDTAVKVLQQQGNAEQTLNAYQWSYQPADTKQPIVLNFADQRLSVATGCNRLMTSAKVENGLLVTGNIASTNMMCSPELMKQESFAAALFQSNKTAFVLDTANTESPTLTLVNATGGKVVFTGKMTPETKYQSQGETIFLEISPETKECSAGVRKMQCLQVREIKYADNGVKTQVDKDWTYFYDQIEGFTHSPAERQVVRVKRYEIKNPAADQSKYAYVQDMIIERETVK